LNILTKISVVVLVVLVLLTSAVMITTSVVPTNYRDEWQKEKGRADLANLTAQNSVLAARAATLELDAAKSELKKVQDQDNVKITQLTTDLNAAKATNVLQGTQFVVYNDRLTDLESHVEVAQRGRDVADKALAEVRKDVGELNQRKAELENQVGKLNADLAFAQDQIRSKSVTIQDLKEQNQKLSVKLAETPGAGAAAAPVPATNVPEVTGKVTEVSGDIVSINVGSAKGLKDGMVLVISRGGQFVAHLRVQRVELGEAAGVLEEKQMDVQQGDTVSKSPRS
jgi:hypothetical protein